MCVLQELHISKHFKVELYGSSKPMEKKTRHVKIYFTKFKYALPPPSERQQLKRGTAESRYSSTRCLDINQCQRVSTPLNRHTSIVYGQLFRGGWRIFHGRLPKLLCLREVISYLGVLQVVVRCLEKWTIGLGGSWNVCCWGIDAPATKSPVLVFVLRSFDISVAPNKNASQNQ